MAKRKRSQSISTAIGQAGASLGNPLRRLQLLAALLVALLLAGAVGYMLLEGMTLVEGLYMTVITVTTVGFGEVRPLSPPGRVFTIGLILLGVGAVGGIISNAVEVVLGNRLWDSVARRRMERQIMVIKNHYVVCGYGRIGQQIVRDLRARDEAYVVLEASEEVAAHLLDEHIPFVLGDATTDETQLEAGITRAKGFVAALDTDADNVLAVLTARGLNPALFIVARAINAESEKKLRRAGASSVVSPYDIGGHRMAMALIRPAVHDFLSHIFDVSELDADIGEIRVRPDSSLIGQTLATCDLRQIRSLSILAIRSPAGEFTFNPNPQRPIQPGETLILIGPPDAIYQLEAEHGASTAA